MFTDIYPNFGRAEGGTVITLKGERFQNFSGCTPFPTPDANGNSYDCFVCVFGRLDLEFPVRYVYVVGLSRFQSITTRKW